MSDSMRFNFTDEQEQFRATIRRFLRDHSPPGEVRSQMATSAGFDRAVWRRACDELGLTGLQVPLCYGGQGYTFVELGIALEEMGRALFCAPYFASAVLATQAILNGATETEKIELLPPIASGERIATLAWVETNGRWDAGGTALTATKTGESHLLEGTKRFVLDGHTADLIIVAAREPGTTGELGLSLFAVEAPCAGLERRLLETIDTTRKLAELVFHQVPARQLGVPGAGAATLARTLDQAAAALACEMVGSARTLLDAAVDYAKLRMQFGRPIGSFQAIKHKCAELLLEVELAHAGACYAVAALAEDDPEASALAALAKACAADACLHAAIDCIQIHGGIGFTWDHDMQLWFKRAKSSEVLLGDACHYRERYLALVEAAT